MMDSTKKLFELYNTMEKNLKDLDITFDEFSILYKTFKTSLESEVATPPPVTATPPNPFPWVKHAGVGWS